MLWLGKLQNSLFFSPTFCYKDGLSFTDSRFSDYNLLHSSYGNQQHFLCYTSIVPPFKRLMVTAQFLGHHNQLAAGLVNHKSIAESIQATSRQYFTFSFIGLCCNRQIFELSKKIFFKKLRDIKCFSKIE